MKVLITGAAGMLGKNILEDSRFSKFQLLTPDRAELNLFDFGAVVSYLAKTKPDVVIHAAGRVGGIQANLAQPVNFLIENIDVGRNVILASSQAKIKKLINLGSSCMYPRDAENPLGEELILSGALEPTNEGYALAKIISQRLCAYIKKEDPSFHYKTLIPSNLYGRYDKFDPSHSHLVPAIFRKLHQAKITGQASVEIWGDGTARREFMYCEDLVDCIYKCLNPKDFEAMPDLMNVGTGQDYSVNEYYRAVAQVVGYTGEFTHNRSKPVGMKQKLVRTTKAESWGWQSQTSLEDGLKKTYQFFKENNL